FFLFITYQQFTALLLTVINCAHYDVYDYLGDSNPNTYRMVAENSTICYVGTHLAAAIFSWLFLFIFSLFLPLFFLIKIYYGNKAKLLDDKEFKKDYGFMYRRIKYSRFYYRSFNWIYMFVSACQIA